MASVSFATFTVLELQYAMLLAVVVGLSVIIPYIGATVVTFPVLLVLIDRPTPLVLAAVSAAAVLIINEWRVRARQAAVYKEIEVRIKALEDSA